MIFRSLILGKEILRFSDEITRHHWKKINRLIIGFILFFGIALIITWLSFQPWVIVVYSLILFGGTLFVYNILQISKFSLLNFIKTHHSQTFLMEIFQTMGNALIVADKDGIITLVNPCLTRLIGIPQEEILGRKAEELFLSEISDMPGVQHENGLLLPSLKEIPVLVTISHTYQQGNLIQIIVLQDIRKQKENEIRLKKYLQKIEQNNLELEQFSYVAAHDLKAPLRAIQNLTEFIEEDMEQVPSGVRQHFQLIKNRIARMENLINGLLEYARVGKKGVNLEITNVKELLEDILENLGIENRSRVEIESELPTLFTHKLLLEQVFANLISNAHKYNTNPSPVIKIGSRDDGKQFEFSVSDNGPGIPADSKEKIFKIFQTLQARDDYESTGVGLSIVKKIVEETGCEIHVDSEPGEGCTFRFTWPRSGAA
jgi:signal transduction histidine kinase